MTYTNYYIPQNLAYSVAPCHGSSQAATAERTSPETSIKVLPTVLGLEILSDKREDLGVESTFGELPQTVITPTVLADPVDKFVARKLLIREAGIKQVANEIAARIRLRDRLLEWIDQNICELKERLYAAAPWGHASPFSVGEGRSVCEGQRIPCEEFEKAILTHMADVVFSESRVQTIIEEVQRHMRPCARACPQSSGD